MVESPFWYKKYKHINCLKASSNSILFYMSCILAIIESIFRRPVKYFTNVRTAPQMFTREF